MMRLISIVVLLAACDDLPSKDDPRTSGSFQESGSCSGFSIQCDKRKESQCNSGCVFAATCHSTAVERCAGWHDINACNADQTCRWVYNWCEVQVGVACTIHLSQSTCLADPEGNCAWGGACTGTADDCFSDSASAACKANAGCGWTPG